MVYPENNYYSIPLKTVYEVCIGNVLRTNGILPPNIYLIIVLVSRFGDTPKIFEKLFQQWNSIHDLTRGKALVIFNAKPARESMMSISIETEFNEYLDDYLYDILRFPFPAQGEFWTKQVFTKWHKQTWGDLDWATQTKWKTKRDEDFYSRHSLGISDFIKYLGKDEKDVPFLHLTYLPSLVTGSIPLDDDSDLYSKIKSIIIHYDEKETAFDKKNQEVNSLLKTIHQNKKMIKKLSGKKGNKAIRNQEEILHLEKSIKDYTIRIEEIKLYIDKKVRGIIESIQKKGEIMLESSYVSGNTKETIYNINITVNELILDQLSKLVEDAKLEEALTLLNNNVNAHEVSALLARFNKLKSQEISGIISREAFSLEFNRICYSILGVIGILQARVKNNM